MLGQVVNHSRLLAGVAYDKVILKVLDKIGGDHFFMTGDQIMTEFGKFCNSKPVEDDQELRHLNVLKQMFKKENFEHMYAGYITYVMMPALYATVLAPLYDQDKQQVSDEKYRNNLSVAKAMLAPRN